MATTPTLTRRAHMRALTAALTLALIALPAQARADAGDEAAPQSEAQSSTAAQPRDHGRARARRPCSERRGPGTHCLVGERGASDDGRSR